MRANRIITSCSVLCKTSNNADFPFVCKLWFGHQHKTSGGRLLHANSICCCYWSCFRSASLIPPRGNCEDQRWDNELNETNLRGWTSQIHLIALCKIMAIQIGSSSDNDNNNNNNNNNNKKGTKNMKMKKMKRKRTSLLMEAIRLRVVSSPASRYYDV